MFPQVLTPCVTIRMVRNIIFFGGPLCEGFLLSNHFRVLLSTGIDFLFVYIKGDYKPYFTHIKTMEAPASILPHDHIFLGEL